MSEKACTRRRVAASACPLLMAAFLLAGIGCTTKLGGRVLHDRYVPDDSTIRPLGNVSASATYWQWWTARPADKALYDEVRAEALQQKGGDLLIDAKVDATLTYYPGILLYQTILEIEGTAAKVISGSREELQPHE